LALPVPKPPLPLIADQCSGILKKSSAVSPEENTQSRFHGMIFSSAAAIVGPSFAPCWECTIITSFSRTLIVANPSVPSVFTSVTDLDLKTRMLPLTPLNVPLPDPVPSLSSAAGPAVVVPPPVDAGYGGEPVPKLQYRATAKLPSCSHY